MNEQELEKLTSDAQKWKVIESSGLLEVIREVYDDVSTAAVELGCLQNLVIEAVEDSEGDVPDTAHIRFALKRLKEFTNCIYYSQNELSEIFD